MDITIVNKKVLVTGGAGFIGANLCEALLERQNKVDIQKFYNFYESNGWKVGKNPMKDWKAAVRTWKRNSNQFTPTTQQTTKISLK